MTKKIIIVGLVGRDGKANLSGARDFPILSLSNALLKQTPRRPNNHLCHDPIVSKFYPTPSWAIWI